MKSKYGSQVRLGQYSVNDLLIDYDLEIGSRRISEEEEVFFLQTKGDPEVGITVEVISPEFEGNDRLYAWIEENMSKIASALESDSPEIISKLKEL